MPLLYADGAIADFAALEHATNPINQTTLRVGRDVFIA
jgi:hypothetical protein